jgi:DNA-binding transcriptional LysR family regulator
MFAAAGADLNSRCRSSSVETVRALVGHGLAYTLLNLQPAVATSLNGHPVVSIALEGGTPLEVALVTAAGGRPTRRATTVAALSTEAL